MIATIEQIAGHRTDVENIETVCAHYASESARLEEMTTAIECELELVRQKHARDLKRQAGIVAGLECDLNTAVRRAPELFESPRTITISGVKVGLMHNPGRLVYDDAETVVEMIKAKFGRSARSYIRTIEEPNKDLLRTLSTAQLKKVGCRIEGRGDVVVVKRMK